MDSNRRWWSSLPDECPITLEPLRDLPYPPFVLTDGGGDGIGGASGCKYYFDGLALSTYVVSQGTFANPLTRHPLAYDDCVRLDEYLNEHIYQRNDGHDLEHFSPVGQGRISVKEAFLLRESIKVKIDGGQNESERRSAEALRNEAAAALRGLFVFGHRSQGRAANNDDGWETVGQASSHQTLARAPGGFNLHYNPDATSSTNQQDGLRIIDDDEAKFEAADVAAWEEVQQAFPHLVPDQPPPDNSTHDGNNPCEILETVRQTARLTMNEEKEELERLRRQRQRYFLQALERKRNRLDARRKAKEEAAVMCLREKQAQEELQSAREEIDRWRSQQWEEWERRAAAFRISDAKDTEASPTTQAPLENGDTNVDEKQSTPPEPTAEEKAAKAAAKKKLKRQKAKERAKEKKRLEKLEQEKKERALALQKEKESSTLKCGACGEGILGCGFEKFGVNFCSPKCARQGASS